MTKRNLKIILLISLISNIGFAQIKTRCAPIKKIKTSNLKVKNSIASIDLLKIPNDSLIRIPVVFHVIHNNSSGKIGGANNLNISDAQIFSQIEVLNNDYRKKIGTLGFNNNPVGDDMQIEFYLANKDSLGNSVSGINRIYYNKNSYNIFNDRELISSLSYWNSSIYLNIWVAPLADDYIGYGEFPGGGLDGLDQNDADATTDGIFIDPYELGNQTGLAVNSLYSFGRTLTHETGHWLGLIHTWGDDYCGSDYCNDTPKCSSENTNKCDKVYSNCNGLKTQNMIENYMDYTPDSCMNVFTKDQKIRVRAVLNASPRRNLMVLNSKFANETSDVLKVLVLDNKVFESTAKFYVFSKPKSNVSYAVYNTLGQVVFNGDYKEIPFKYLILESSKIGKGLFIVNFTDGNSKISKRIILN